MAHRTLPQGIRQEFLSYRGHQVVITYDETTEQCNHVWVETNGSVKRHLVIAKDGNSFSVFDGQGRPRGELLVDWLHLTPNTLLGMLTQRDLDE